MTVLGFYEARTRLSELLDDVANGKQVLITRRGKPAAVISPPPKQKSANVSEVVVQCCGSGIGKDQLSAVG